MGFTHIEFLPVSEHPYDPSWGYQTTGLYAPSARFGDPEGFARFVDGAHRAGLGVLLDWVPAHFPDRRRMAWPGSTAPRSTNMKIRGWASIPTGTPRSTTSAGERWRAFLVNNALFWAERYHVDGLRVDAVASMLYRDYSRKAANGSPTRRAAARIGKRSASCGA